MPIRPKYREEITAGFLSVLDSIFTVTFAVNRSFFYFYYYYYFLNRE